MPISGSKISRIGEGLAQVFEPYKSTYGADLYNIKAKKEAAKQKQEGEIYKDLGKADIAGVFYKHQPVFAQKQKELYDYVKTNIDKLRSGDAGATIEYQNRLTTLGTDIGLSKNTATGYKEMFSEYIKNQNKYRPDAEDYLHNFTGYDETTGQFEVPDMGQLKSQTDLGADFQKHILPLLEDAKIKGEISWDNPNGSVSTKKTSELTKQDADFILTGRLKDPVVFEQTVYDYTKENPDNPNPSNEDLQGFYYDRYVKIFVKKEEFISKTEGRAPKEPSEGDKEKLTGADITEITYTVPNPKAPTGTEQVKTRGITLPSNVSLNIASDVHVINRQTKKSLKDADGKIYVGQLNVSGGSVGLDRIIEGGKEVYKPMLFSIATNAEGEKIEVQIPISKLRGQKVLEKYASEALDALQQEADKLNGEKGTTKKVEQKAVDLRKKYNY